MKDKIERVLLNDGYRKMSSNVPEFTVYYEVYGAVANVVQVIDYHLNIHFTREQYEHVKEQINRMLAQKGYLDIHIFTLILADYPDEAREISREDKFSWVIDKAAGSVYAGEGHVEDFYGIGRLVETVLNDEPGAFEGEGRGGRPLHQGWEAGRDERQTGQRAGVIRSNLSPVNLGIIVVNAAVFIVLEIMGSTQDPYFMLRHGAMHPLNVIIEKEYYRLFTCIFMHFGFEHLASNMFILFFLGDNVERVLGKWRYLFLYLVSGIAGSAISCLTAYILVENVTGAGASGAIFGTIGALLYIVIRNKGRLEDMTTLRVALLIAYSLFMGFTSQGVDNVAHVGGLATGFILAVAMYRGKNNAWRRLKE